MSRTLSAVLRPYLHTQVKPKHRDVYLRFYAAAAGSNRAPAVEDDQARVDSLWSSGSYTRRIEQLDVAKSGRDEHATTQLYPRWRGHATLSPRQIKAQVECQELGPRGWDRDKKYRTQGRIISVRAMSKKLIFLDIMQDEGQVQVMIDLKLLHGEGDYQTVELESLRKRISVGDYYYFTGYLHRTGSGEPTLAVVAIPELLSPSLHVLPSKITDPETLARLPQLDLVLNRKRRDLLRLRHLIEKEISNFLDDHGYTKVSTPILAADTGGAAAQPFETSTQEIPEVPLRMRIAPELALKKLIAAGMQSVYEIGPSFRNEGLDATHNPEFTTCEFYEAYTNLDALIAQTEELYHALANACDFEIQTKLESLDRRLDPAVCKTFARMRFLPTLIECLKTAAPDFQLPKKLDDSANSELIPLFSLLGLDVPRNPSTARLLDDLSAHFLEPLCVGPTWITEHPAIMSPLAKSFVDKDTGHQVSARAELFIKGTEYVNTYEEENDPFEQARKFLQQSRGSDALVHDSGTFLSHEQIKRLLTPGQQYYIRVLEMGLPPTGGWGCGIDRLVMYFGGAKKISEVLPFGNLRNVIAMGTAVDAKGRLVINKQEAVHNDSEGS